MEEKKTKKKLNKKILSFAIVGVLSLMVISALVVNYLSNTVDASVSVESPISLQIGSFYGGGSSDFGMGSMQLTDKFSGDEINLYLEMTNNANTLVEGNLEMLVTNGLGITCEDFASLSVGTVNEIGEESPQTIPECSDISETVVQLRVLPLPHTWEANSYSVLHLNIQLANTVGEYTFSSKVIPN